MMGSAYKTYPYRLLSGNNGYFEIFSPRLMPMGRPSGRLDAGWNRRLVLPMMMY
jgi:hypothetical protein